MNRTLRLIAIAIVIALPVIVFAQEPSTNASISYYDGAGKTITVPVTNSYVKLILDHLTAFILTLSAVSVSFLGRLVLMFLPAAKDPNSWLAKMIALLKNVSASTPDRHTDIVVVEDKLAESPRTNVTLEPGVGMGNTQIPSPKP